MKRNYILQTLVLLFIVFTANAQRGINYKALIKDGQGNAISNASIVIHFSIFQGNDEIPVFAETHNAVTDANGIVIVNIGEVMSGGAELLADLPWGESRHFLKTEINTGSGLIDMGTTEFKTVPYALYANSSDVSRLNDLDDVIVTASNVFIGQGAGLNNSQGGSNAAIGINALNSNTAGFYNSAIGHEVLYNNTFGRWNTANGYQALYSNTSGRGNTAIGHGALRDNAIGESNTAVGMNALSNSTGDNNIAIGSGAHVLNSAGSNQIRMGNTNISYAGIQVAWTVTSDKRWKENIRELPYGLDMLMQLKPVDYTRKNNENKTREMGFIAQDVEIVFDKMGYADQGLLSTDDKGFMSLRYNDFIILLTKATQEQQAIINSLNSKLEDQEKDIQDLKAELGQLSSLVNQIIQNEENLKVAEK